MKIMKRKRLLALLLCVVCSCSCFYFSSPVDQVKSKTFVDNAVFPDDYTEEEIAEIEKNGSITVVPGDANGNGTINILDLVFFKQALLNPDTVLTVTQKSNSDMNEDLRLDTSDFFIMKKMILNDEYDESETELTADEFYAKNSEKVLGVEDAAESSLSLTEEQAVSLMKEKGFTRMPLTYDYSIDGTWTGETEAKPDSKEKHAMYHTYYISANDILWNIHLVGNNILANPLSYDLVAENNALTMFSESESIISWHCYSNKYYITVPKESALILKITDEINSGVLDKLTFDAIDSYKNK